MKLQTSRILVLLAMTAVMAGFVFAVLSMPAYADGTMPTMAITLGESDNPDDVVPAMKIIALLTLLAVAPAILLMTTSFTRILIVLSFVRQALGTQTMPPNQILVGLSLFLTLFTMSPVLDHINENAYTPYVEKKISQSEAFDNAVSPMRQFMLAQTREEDLGIFMKIAKLEKPSGRNDVPLRVLMPAFLVSELKTAFQIGFLIYVPFLIIDMVVSSVLMAMGMLMLPPTVISLPFKLVLFVLVDGWTLIVEQIVQSFNLA